MKGFGCRSLCMYLYIPMSLSLAKIVFFLYDTRASTKGVVAMDCVALLQNS